MLLFTHGCRRRAMLSSLTTLVYLQTLEIAIDTVIGIYVRLLIRLHEEKGLTIYVHPVMPVLDITR